MTILNQGRIYYLYTMRNEGPEEPKLERRQSTGAVALRKFQDSNYYYYEFRLANAFKVFPLTRLLFPVEIERIKTGNAFLAINNSHEAFHEVVDGIYETLVLEQGIPAQQIILLSESADIDKVIEISAKKYNQPKIKAEWILQFEWNVQMDRRRMLRERTSDEVHTLENKKYNKKFLNFNRRWRPHRVAFVALLKSLGILDQGYVSLGNSDDNNSWHRVWHWIKFVGSHNNEIKELFDTHDSDISNLPPLYLDTENLVQNQADLNHTTNYLYADSYFSVVSETNFYTNTLGVQGETGRFLSEKTFKPIAMRHPFLILSVPNMLDKLKEIGYQTFSPWIDESYDKELDDNKRMLMVAKEVKRLCELPPEELTKFLLETRKIVEHNFNVFINRQNFFYRLNYNESELKINRV
jgi:hypothetical protein